MSATIPASHADLLTLPIAPTLATVGPNGEPQCTPVWFSWDGGLIHISLTTQRQKYRNLLTRPQVALAFVDPENMYRSMEVRGSATAVESDADRALVNSLAERYMGIDTYTFDSEGTERVAVSITPTHITTWE